MCYVWMAYAAMAGATVHSAEQSRKTASQGRTQQREMAAAMESDREQAEAKAAQRAQAEIQQTQRRRQRQSLLSSGATTQEPTPYATSTLTDTAMTASRSGRRASLLSQGGAPTITGG